MKKFKQPLAIKGSKEELEALIAPLKELGYKLQRGNEPLTNYQNNVLITNWDNKNGLLGFDGGTSNRLEVPASNKDLCLALAAMKEGEDWEAGEWLVCDLSDLGDKKHLFKVIGMKYNSYEDGQAKNGCISYRKATTEEIINHFKQKDMKEKKIVGYKIIKQYPGMDKKFLGDIIQPPLYKFSDGKTMFPGACFDEKSPYYNSSFINEFLEPAYEEEKKIIKVNHSNGILEVEIKDGKACFENNSWVKAHLNDLISPNYPTNGNFVPESFTAGCNGQYKNISREDIQRVINALN